MSHSFDPYHLWLGIGPEEQPPNHYRLLGIPLFETNPEVIRDAAMRQMAHVRTYQLGPHSDLSQKILNELGAAKACLLNPAQRTAYEAQLKAKLKKTVPKESAEPALPDTLAFLESTTPSSDAAKPGRPATSKHQPQETATSHRESAGPSSLPLANSWPLWKISIGAGAGLFLILLLWFAFGGKKESPVAQVPSGLTQDTKENVAGGDEKGAAENDGASPSLPPLKSDKPSILALQPTSPTPTSAPGDTTPVEPPPSPPVVSPPPESVQDTRTRLEKALKEAKTPSEFNVVGYEAITAAERAFDSGDQENGKAIATLAVAASRSSGNSDLMRKATLVFLRGR